MPKPNGQETSPLDPWIIERIRQEEERKRRQDAQVPLELPDYDGWPRDGADTPSEPEETPRGVVIMDITGNDKEDSEK